MKARIVIGANAGDEGKGTVVATYAKHSEKVLNVLTNGGAQRGHSILTEDGSMSFHHFGSGTYHGADNYYSRYFILNPMQFVKEYNELIVKPKTYRDKKCLWSTPYDSMANLISEQQKNRHASCCMGIWNTIKRTKETGWVSFDDFVNSESPLLYLKKVKGYYERNITIPESWKSTWDNVHIALHFMEDCRFMFNHTVACELASLNGYENLIFENGQGLILCDTGKDTFDTTPSNTGILYSLELLKDLDVESVTAHYVTRPYLTRHGDGNLNGETERVLISKDVAEDRTNHYNDGQGNFRYGILDIPELQERIFRDEQNAIGTQNFGHVLEITHCDEMDRIDEFRKYFTNINTYDSPLIK